MTEEWGPWIEHDGKGCPVPIGTLIENVDVCATTWKEYPPSVGIVKGGNGWRWSLGKPSRSSIDPAFWARPIIRYRIRKPRALLDLIERAKEIDDAPEGPVRAPAKRVTA